MNTIPLAWWLPLSMGACVLLVAAAGAWLWRQALRADTDARAARRMALLASLGLLLWLAYGLAKGYGPLWRGDAFVHMAQAPAFVQLPLLIGGIAWMAALLVGRVLRLRNPT